MELLNTFLFLSMPGGTEWILIIFVVLLLFGGKKIPELMKGIGKGIKSFKDGMKEGEEEAKAGDKLNNPKLKE